MTRALKITALAAGIAGLMGVLAITTCFIALSTAHTTDHAIQGADHD